MWKTLDVWRPKKLNQDDTKLGGMKILEKIRMSSV